MHHKRRLGNLPQFNMIHLDIMRNNLSVILRSRGINKQPGGFLQRAACGR